MRYSFLTITFLFLLDSFIKGQTVSGTVFRDFNSNGVFENAGAYKEVGTAGVTVTAYSASNTVIATTTSSKTGTYILNTGAGRFRIEFSNFPIQDYTSFHGSDNNTSVQFVNGGNTNINFGINYPANYCETTDPQIATPCYINGDPLLPGANMATDDVLVGFPYSASTEFPAVTHLAIANQIGTTWGIAYQRETKFLFASAFVKRYSGFGPSGISAIYKIDRNTNAVSTFVKLSDIGINVGANPHNDLPNDKNAQSYDSLTFKLVGKLGIGSITLSDDGKYLFVANLFNKRIYKIFIDNPARTPTAADVSSFRIPLTDCPNGDGFPFALKFYRGSLYVGVTSTGETSQNINDVKGLVYKLDVNTGVFTKVLTIPFNFKRGYPDVLLPNVLNWYPWTSSVNKNDYTFGGNYAVHPQPLLSAIEFDVEGSMVVDVMDKIGNQMGNNNHWPTKLQQFNISTVAGGNILRAEPNGSVWTLENNGTSNGISTAGVGSLKGPGGGLYYYDQEMKYHQDLSMGSLALLPGSGTVVFSAIDATDNTVFSGGFRWMNNNDGSQNHNTLIYNGVATNFGKADGLGGTTLMCAPPPIEIGNRVWVDTNNDGIQNPNESAIVGATVKLYNNISGVLLATAITDASGTYYFSSSVIPTILPNTTYKIVVDALGNDASANNLNLNLISPNGISGINNGTTLSNNDAVIVAGKPTIIYTTGNWGENNHTLDFGFVPCPTVSISSPSNLVCVGGNVTLSATVTNPNNVCTLQWQKSPDGNLWSNIPGATGNAYTSPQNTTAHYRVTFTCTGNVCCN